MKLIRFVIFVMVMLTIAPNAVAQMPAPPPGFVHVGPPWFEGAECIYSSPTILAHNWYGSYRLDVIPGAPGVGLWEQANSYRGGGVSLEPIAILDGVPMLVQDATATFYFALIHDGTDAIHEASIGHHQFFTIGAGHELQMFAPAQIPGGGSTHHTDIGHDDTEGWIDTPFGDLLLDAANDVYTMDDFGIGTNAPSESLDVIGSIQMVDGNQLINTFVGDDGTGTGIQEWIYEHSKTAFVCSKAAIEIDNSFTLANPDFFDFGLTIIGPLGGVVQCRNGSATGIGIYAVAVVKMNPASVDTLGATFYINGISTGFGILIPPAAPTFASGVQAILISPFMAGDTISLGFHYINNGGPATSFQIVNAVGNMEVHYD